MSLRIAFPAGTRRAQICCDGCGLAIENEFMGKARVVYSPAGPFGNDTGNEVEVDFIVSKIAERALSKLPPWIRVHQVTDDIRRAAREGIDRLEADLRKQMTVRARHRVLSPRQLISVN